MKCGKYLLLIDDWVDNDLDGETAVQVNLHVSACRECKLYYETLKQERVMYEQYFEVEPSNQSWSGLQSKLKAAQKNNTNKSTRKFAGIFTWKPNIFEHLRLTPILTCAALCLFFGIGFGLVKFLPINKVSENALMTEKQPAPPKETVAGSAAIMKDKSQIPPEKNKIFEDGSLRVNQKDNESEISDANKEIVVHVKAKKSFNEVADDGNRIVSTQRKEFSAERPSPNEKEQISQLQTKIQKPYSEEDFYSLPFAGIFDADKEQLQILRVELPRSSLIALGVNLQAENGAANIKADLLIGSDGITRAVRLLK